MPTERNVARLWTPRVSPRHKHKFHGGGVFPQGKFLKQFFTGKETCGTPVVSAAATSINFTNGRGIVFFTRTKYVTPLVVNGRSYADDATDE